MSQICMDLIQFDKIGTLRTENVMRGYVSIIIDILLHFKFGILVIVFNRIFEKLIPFYFKLVIFRIM